MGFQSPTSFGIVSSGWGDDRSYRSGIHEGIDIVVPIGTPLYAIEDGVVHRIVSAEVGGNQILLKVGKVYALYSHLSKFLVNKGDVVRKGQIIGLSGNTGIKSSAPHLHFGLRVEPSFLSSFWSFGKITPAVGAERNGLVAVPSEPFIPVQQYPAYMLERLAKRGVPIYKSKGATTVVAVGVGLGGAYALWKIINRHRNERK